MKIKLQPNILLIVSILLILYVVFVKCMCVAKEYWWFGAQEEEDDGVDEVATFGPITPMMQEFEEEKEATQAAIAPEPTQAAVVPTVPSVDCRSISTDQCLLNPACKMGHKNTGPFQIMGCQNK